MSWYDNEPASPAAKKPAANFWELNPPKSFEELETAINSIPEELPVDEKLRLRKAFSETLAEDFFKNAEIASYAHEQPSEEVSEASFTLFPKLPAELRVRIWQYALSVPQIVELLPLSPEECRVPGCDVDSCHAHRLGGRWHSLARGHWHFKNKNPPALLTTNIESRKEAITVYEQYQKIEDITFQGPVWYRPDHDILFLKDVEIIRYDNFLNNGNKWETLPTVFANAKALAMNYEVFYMFGEDAISRFFPDLVALIVLFDDETDICKEWKAPGRTLSDTEIYETYDFYQGPDRFKEDLGFDRSGDEVSIPLFPRAAFVKASTGPFYKKVFNEGYAASAKLCVEGYIESEEKERYRHSTNYCGPKVEVMGCSLPPGLELPYCGRTQYNEFGYNEFGYNQDGWDVDGYNGDSFDKDDVDKEGYDRAGFDAEGFDRNGYNSDYDVEEDFYDRDGYDANGYDRGGYDRDGQQVME